MPSDKPWLRFYDSDVPREIAHPDRSLVTMLLETANRFPRKAALWSSHGSLSYEQLVYNVRCFASVLKRMGIGPGQRVLVVLPNCLHQVVALYGTLWVGASCVLTSPDFPCEILEAQIRDCQAHLAVLPTPLPDALESLHQVMPEHLIFCSGREYNRSFRGWLRVTAGKLRQRESRVQRWRQLMSEVEPDPHHAEVDSEQTALILYTGGTTGAPRGVELSHRALWANAMQLAAWDCRMELGKERILCTLPLSHSYGCSTCLSLAIRGGSTLILCDSLRPADLLDYCNRFKPSIFPAVPALYGDLLAYARLRSANIHSIRACICGAAPLPVEIQEGFEKVTRGRLVEGYGLTEAGPVTHANPFYGNRKPGSIGIPMPSTEAVVLDLETGLEAPPGQVGELIVRGPQIMNGYFNNPEATSRAIRNGWLHTGDIVQRDGDGYFYVISRRTDCLSLEGQTVYPRDIEEVVYQHPAIREVAVVGWPAPDRFTDLGFAVARGLRAFVSVRPERRLTLDELEAFCRRHLPPQLLPREWKIVQQLPRTPFGKVSRPKLYDGDEKSSP